MQYIIQILAAILIGTSLGTILGPRSNLLFMGCLVAIALGVLTIITPSWLPLVIGTVVFLVVCVVPGSTRSA